MKPPRHPNPQAGETWFVQRVRGNPVLTAEIDESTARTVLLRWQDDGAIRVRRNLLPIRMRKTDLMFLERIP